MFDQYTLIMHQALDVMIMVPDQWPARAEPILITLVEKIMERFNDLSPIVRVNNMPTRLIRRVVPAGVFYVFDKVAEKEIPGAYVYDVIIPDNGEAIRLEITSGTTLCGASWSPPPERTLSHAEQIYHYLSSTKLRNKFLSAAGVNKRTSKRRRLRRKRVHKGARKCDNYHGIKYKRMTG